MDLTALLLSRLQFAGDPGPRMNRGGDPADQSDSRQQYVGGMHGSNSRGYVGRCA